MATLWKLEEIDFLKNNYINMTDEELSIKLNYTTVQIAEKRRYEGFTRRKPNFTIDWNSLEKDYETEKDLDVLAIKYNIKSKSSIRDHLIKKGLYIHEVVRWKKEELQYLKDNINKLSIVEISQNLKRPISSVKHKLQRSNISLSNIPVYFYDNCIFYDEKEKVLFDLIKDRLDKGLLVDSKSINNIVEFDLYKYCMSMYGVGYESFLKMFFNIDHEKYLHENCINIYKTYYKENETLDMPQGFWSLDNIVIICKYLFKEFSIEYFYENYSRKFLKKYGILSSHLNDNGILIYEFAKMIFPEHDIHPFLFKNTPCPNGYWDNPDNRFLAVDYMVTNLLNDKLIASLDEITRLTTEDFKKYNLGGLLTGRFMYDILSEYLLRKTGKQYEKCEFQIVTNGHWKDTNNVKDAIKWVLEEKEKWDGKNVDWVKNNFSSDLLKKHGLGGMLVSKRGVSICDLFISTYPNIDIFPWEFNSTPHYYWTEKETSNLALKQLIEYRLKLSIEDIPKFISRTYFQFNYQKFMTPLIKLYDGNIFKWINSIYPNIFTCRDFGYIECLDGTIVKSLTEQIIHNYLISKYKNVEYIENGKENEGIYKDTKYIPDWIISDYVIIEYFGLYKNNKTNIDKYDNYHSKTKEKLKIANDSELSFVFLYESDLKNNLQGLKDKITRTLKSK